MRLWSTLLGKLKQKDTQLLLAGFFIYSFVIVLVMWDYGNKFTVWNARFFWVGIPLGLVYYYIQYRFSLRLLHQKEYIIFFVRLVIAFLALAAIYSLTIYVLIPEKYLLHYFSGLLSNLPKNANKDTTEGLKTGISIGFVIGYAINKAFWDIAICTMVLYFYSKILTAAEPIVVEKSENERLDKIRLYSWHVFAWVLYHYLSDYNKILKQPMALVTESLMILVSIGFFYLSYFTSFKLLIRGRVLLSFIWICFLWFVLIYVKAFVFAWLVNEFHFPAFIYGEDVMPEIKKAIASIEKAKFNPFKNGGKGYMAYSFTVGQVLLQVASKEFFILLCSIFYGYALKLLETQKRLLASQILSLKAQINPHFLFNSLNFLYARALPLSEDLAKSTMLLSEIMRYGLKGTDEEDKVPLENEIKHLENFIEFNQLRFSNRLNVYFEKTGNVQFRRIMPLLLITFVENAFKYGELLDENYPVNITLRVEGGNLYFTVSNKKRIGPRELLTGVGLQNIKARLELVYPKKHAIRITDEEHFYKIELKIQL
ncbi:sensor histidine kinase [Runella sp.]|uniref:sensor histidine kinase n=1 Tax=Runella sp. TaxID=1960881 RepID=UPI002623DC33|nr:histidine kinase [Runella sp.]